LKIIFRKYFLQNLNLPIIFLFLNTLLFSGCAKEQRIKEKIFVKIYSDLVIAQDSLAADSSMFVNVQNKIFLRYNVNKDLYIKTLGYYKKNPGKWKLFFKKVIAYLREKEKKKP